MRREWRAKVKGLQGLVCGITVARRHVGKLWMLRGEKKWYDCRLSPRLWGEGVPAGALLSDRYVRWRETALTSVIAGA